MRFDIITIFPKIFNSYFSESILKRAQKQRIINIKAHDLRQWTADRHKTVDDAPYGGGAGMVIKIDPLYQALRDIKSKIKNQESGERKKIPDPSFLIPDSKIVLLSAKGQTWSQQTAQKYSRLDNLILICGRYEGVDERIVNYIDEEISIGDYILTGGEIGAMAIIDSISRLLPGTLGNEQSQEQESHTEPGILGYPQYTRPEVFIDDNGNKYEVPKVLLSGNHKEIEEWRRKRMKKKG